MEWAISTNSANILTHLRDLGYPIPLDIIEKYPLVIRDYLLGEGRLFSILPIAVNMPCVVCRRVPPQGSA